MKVILTTFMMTEACQVMRRINGTKMFLSIPSNRKLQTFVCWSEFDRWELNLNKVLSYDFRFLGFKNFFDYFLPGYNAILDLIN
jgi:hypothetical protein